MILTDNSVSVTLRLKNQFEETLKKLEKRLDKIDSKKVSPDFELNAEDEIKNLETKLKKLDTDSITPDVDIRGKREITSTKALIESLSGQETVHLKVKEHGDGSLLEVSPKTQERVQSGADSARTRDFKQQYRNIKNREHSGLPGRVPYGGIGGGDFEQMGDRHLAKKNLPGKLRRGALSASNLRSNLGGFHKGGTRSRIGIPDIAEANAFRRNRRGVSKSRAIRRGGGALKRFLTPDRDNKLGGASGDILSAFIPSGKMSRQVSSMIMAAVMSVIKPAAGIIAGMGSTLLAGGLIGGLGLMGMGSTAPQAKKMAGVRAGIMGRETFQAMKPASSHFAPFVDNMMQTIPGKLAELNGPLMGLDVFEGTIESSIDGMIDWFGELLTVMAEMEGMISQLTKRFGSALGSGIIKLFRWLVKEAYNSQNAFAGIMEMFGSVIVLAIQLFEIWGKTMTVLTPLFKLLGKVASVMNNKYGVALLQIVLLLSILVKITMKVVAAKLLLQAVMNSQAFATMASAIGALIGKYFALTSAIMSAAAAKALLMGLAGAVALGAGYAAYKGVQAMSPDTSGFSGSPGGGGGGGFGGGSPSGFSGGNGGGGGTVVHQYTMNVEGDTNKDSINRFRDMAAQEAREQDDIRANESKGLE